MPDQGGMSAIQPEVVAVLVQNEGLRRNIERQIPFPAGHDHLTGTNHAANVVTISPQDVDEPTTSGSSRVVGKAIYRTITGQSARLTRITRHNINDRGRPMVLVDARNEPFQHVPATAFDQQHSAELRNIGANYSAHGLDTPAIVLYDLVDGFVLISQSHQF